MLHETWKPRGDPVGWVPSLAFPGGSGCLCSFILYSYYIHTIFQAFFLSSLWCHDLNFNQSYSFSLFGFTTQGDCFFSPKNFFSSFVLGEVMSQFLRYSLQLWWIDKGGECWACSYSRGRATCLPLRECFAVSIGHELWLEWQRWFWFRLVYFFQPDAPPGKTQGKAPVGGCIDIPVPLSPTVG